MTNPDVRCSIHQRALLAVGGRALCPACLFDGSKGALARFESHGERQRLGELNQRLFHAEIPPLFADATFDNFEPATEKAEKVRRALARYSEDFAVQRHARPGFIFTGQPGTGKTHLACAALQEVISRGFTARYASLPAITLSIRRSYKSSEALTAADVIDDITSADLLVLDELDLHGASDSDYQTLYEIINRRYEQGAAPIIALSNRTIEDLKRDLDERLTTRILGSLSATQFDWPGRRI